jgi:hypothetical protein
MTLRRTVPSSVAGCSNLLLLAFQGGAGLDYVNLTGAISSLELDNGATEVEMGDVNGDGCPDLVSVGDHGSPNIGSPQHGITLWLGDCAGGWTLVQTGNFGYGGVALGDVNADGRMDVGYAVHHNYSSTDFGDQLIEVALGTGSGSSWIPWDDGLATNGEDYGMFGADFGDVDGDGDLDLGSNSFGCCAGVHVYRNNGNGSWSQTFGFLGGNSNHTFEFADFDGDGHLDAASGNSLGRVWLGDGLGGFAAADGNLPANQYFGLSTGDLDGDGRDELCYASGGQARIWSWSSGNQWVDRSANLAAVSIAVERTEVADMDRDGTPDLVAAGNGFWGVYDLLPSGLWRPLYSGPAPGTGNRHAVFLRSGLDLDHNGYPDVSLIQSQPQGSFSTQNYQHLFAEARLATELDIAGLAPTSGRVWRAGQVRFVEWASAAPGGDLGLVDLYLTTDGGQSYSPLAQGLTNSGRAQVAVPSLQSTGCRLIYVVTPQNGERRRFTGPAFTILP